jgi:flagellar biosynthesis/type III secretory pathway protein FliH
MADAGQDEAATDAQHADENREVVHAEMDAELQADADADTEIETGTEIETETETEQDDVIAASAQEAMNEIDEIDDAATVDTDTELETAVEALADAQAEPEEVAATPDLSSEAMTALLDAAREEARAAAREEGFDAGYAQAQSELKKEHDTQIEALQKLNAGVQELANDSDALFEPLHKLALHLAEQLVRGELTQSGLAISRLVDNALREMAGSGEKVVMVQLNPDDLELYRPLVAQLGDSMTLRSNTALKRGSVRVSLDGSVVEDLIERRIEGLGKSLAQPPAAGWRNGPGTSLSARLESGSGSRQTVQDVTAKDVAAPTPSDSTVEMMADAVEAQGDGDHA